MMMYFTIRSSTGQLKSIKQTYTLEERISMKTFVIEEKFVGYADITIEAETEEEAIAF